MAGIIVKILLELLSVLAIATKQIKQGRFSEPATVYKCFCSMYFREVRKEVARGKRS